MDWIFSNRNRRLRCRLSSGPHCRWVSRSSGRSPACPVWQGLVIQSLYYPQWWTLHWNIPISVVFLFHPMGLSSIARMWSPRWLKRLCRRNALVMLQIWGEDDVALFKKWRSCSSRCQQMLQPWWGMLLHSQYYQCQSWLYLFRWNLCWLVYGLHQWGQHYRWCQPCWLSRQGGQYWWGWNCCHWYQTVN